MGLSFEIDTSYPAHSGNYKSGGNTCKYIVIHNTGNTASALAEAKYAHTSQHSSSYHYVLDGSECYRTLAPKHTAWAVGAWSGCTAYVKNSESISIEVCSAGTAFTKKERAMLAELVPWLMDKYGIDADHVVRHYDCHSGHKSCPAYYVSASRWETLKAEIVDGDADSSASNGVGTVKDVQAWVGTTQDGVYGPKTKAAIVKKLQTALNKQCGAGLTVDGVFGPKTKAAVPTLSAKSKYNKTNIVKALKAGLICEGYSVTLGKQYGGKVRKAVKKLKKAEGFAKVTAYAGKKVFAVLFG